MRLSSVREQSRCRACMSGAGHFGGAQVPPSAGRIRRVQRGGCASGDNARRARGLLREGKVGTVDWFIETETSLGPYRMVWGSGMWWRASSRRIWRAHTPQLISNQHVSRPAKILTVSKQNSARYRVTGCRPSSSSMIFSNHHFPAVAAIASAMQMEFRLG